MLMDPVVKNIYAFHIGRY